jgi:hypothetical protein
MAAWPRRDDVKRCLALGLLLAGTQAAAQLMGSPSGPVECGPAMPSARIDRMKTAVREANARVLQRFNELNQELGGRQKSAATDAAKAEVDRMAGELGGLIQLMQAGDGTHSALESASLLAAIRDQTVYGGDKVALNARLSASLFDARQEAEKAYQYIIPALAKITLPGVSADAAGIRDSIEAVLKAVGHCLPPAQAAPAK